MTPGARVAAAIEILNDMSEGLAAEQALTRWARRSRFAGSKDRAAIRDHVFDVLRSRRTAAHYGGGQTGRALLIGLLKMQGADLSQLFNAQGHAPQPLSEAETVDHLPPEDKATLWNLPDWILPEFENSLEDAAAETAMALQTRAPVCLRVNLAKCARDDVRKMLCDEGVETNNNSLAETALTVCEGARKIRNSEAYLEGYVELQDAASQAIVEAMPRGARILDYCAGGGGKALAISARNEGLVFAHDIEPKRMSDLPIRAERAGSAITILKTDQLEDVEPFDVVLCDAPCSGSGAWRRAAEGKWTLTPERLNDLNCLQDEILDKAQRLVAPGGTLVYATCSVFRRENEDRVSTFLAANPGWKCGLSRTYHVDSNGDGFFTSHLTRDI